MFAWGFGALLLAVWGTWFGFGQVSVYETSRAARLEVKQLPHHVATLFAGRVAAAGPAVGQDVAADDILVELDAGADRLRLAEEESRLAAMPPRMASMRLELEAMEAAKAEDIHAAAAARDAAQARAREAEAAVRFARANAMRLAEQSQAGGVAKIEALRAQAEVDKLAAAKDVLVAEQRRLERDQQTRVHETQARIEGLRRAIVGMEGDIATARATVARLADTIARHVIRAPVGGRIGDAVPLHAGAYVTEGQRLISIVPPGDLVIVAEFSPAAALGRVRPGQSARLRLDGFPWAQFGTIDATVTQVASEIRDNMIRVELQPDMPRAAPTPMQHGLPGAVEVAIEQASPAALALRAAGLLLAAPAHAATPSGAR